MRVPTSLLLLSAALAAAGDVVKLPAPPKPEWQVIQCDPRSTVLSVDGPADWHLIDDESGGVLVPGPDRRTATFVPPADGVFRVVVVAEKQVHRLKLVKGTDPGPGPGPGPKPPDPPPTDPLARKLQVGYDADTRPAADKRADLLDLVELYKQAAVLAAATDVTTTGELVRRVRDAAGVLKIDGLAECRKTISGELAAAMPEDVPLAADTRKRAAELFARIHTALKEVK